MRRLFDHTGLCRSLHKHEQMTAKAGRNKGKCDDDMSSASTVERSEVIASHEPSTVERSEVSASHEPRSTPNGKDGLSFCAMPTHADVCVFSSLSKLWTIGKES